MPRTLLLSAATQARLGGSLEALLAPHALTLCRLEDLQDPAAAAACQVHAAYISRDVTGQSTKFVVQEPLATCYRVLRQSAALQWVHTHSAGADRPIYAELAGRGVAVSTSAGANAEVVAQTALGAVLALARRLPRLVAAQARRQWAPLFPDAVPPDLSGQTVLLVGWGGIAQRLLPWFTMLGLRVIVARHRAEPAAGAAHTVCYAELAAVLPQAQWLVLACPLSAHTERLIDAAALARLPAGAMLVNVARGEVVDEDALVHALQSGHLGGAFLDVFRHEPLAPESPLWTLPNTLVTPHSAGQAQGNPARAAAIFLDNLGRWLRGEALRNRVSLPPETTA